MGGFEFDKTDESGQTSLKYGSRLRLLPGALIFLAKFDPELIPNITVHQIRDKSKANGLAKALVCLQAFWFCAQCLSRLSSEFSISLLELNTFAHAIYALLSYAFWWNKPLDIEEPTLIQGKKAHECHALMQFIHRDRRHGGQQSDSSLFREYCEAQGSAEQQTTGSPPMEYQSTATASQPEHGQPSHQTPCAIDQPLPHAQISTDLLPVDTCQSSQLHLRRLLESLTLARDEKTNEHSEKFDSLPEIEKRLQLAYKALRRYELNKIHGRSRYFFRRPNARWRYLVGENDISTSTYFDKEKLISDRCRNWPRVLTWSPNTKDREKPMWIGLLLAGSLYGGIHLLAWNAPFPSRTERLLWHVSGVTIMCFAGFAYTIRRLYYFAVLYCSHNRAYKPSANIHRCFSGGYTDLCCSGGLFLISEIIIEGSTLFYLLIRLYIVVESLISVAYLPETAFRKPSWSNYFPHLS